MKVLKYKSHLYEMKYKIIYNSTKNIFVHTGKFISHSENVYRTDGYTEFRVFSLNC